MVDITYQEKLEKYLNAYPLANVGFQYLKRATKNDILSVLKNIKTDDDLPSDLQKQIAAQNYNPKAIRGYFKSKYQDTYISKDDVSSLLDVNDPSFSIGVRLSDNDNREQEVAGHELAHLGLSVLRKASLINNETFFKYSEKGNPYSLEESLLDAFEFRTHELQGRPFENMPIASDEKASESNVKDIDRLANEWLNENKKDLDGKGLNYGTALEEEVKNINRKETLEKQYSNPEKIDYIRDNTMPMIPPPGIKETNIADIRAMEVASENPEFLPPQKETDSSTYAKGGDVGEGYATDNYKQFRERNTPVSIEPNTDFINAIPKGLGSLNWGEILEESIPGVGETIIADSLADNIKNKEFKDAAIDGVALAMGVIPFVGDVASKSIRKLKSKKGTLEKPLNFKEAQKNKSKKELQKDASNKIAERMEIYKQSEQSAFNKYTDTFGGFGDLKVGDRIEGVTFGGTKTSHKIKGLTMSPIGGRLEGREKRIKEYIKRYKTLHKEKIKQEIFPKEPTLIYDETTKITWRPMVNTIRNDGTESGLYYDMISHKGINKFGIKKYAKGGDIMPMEQQMQMFAIGGLDDDGMSRDPISGNEIPPGSMANEVRDDVDAKLSDGEYVVPANVVRFFGVKFFEDLRTQAMQGLDTMEANGRIGGEPVPSDMPMQDQMAEIMPDVSEEEMQMLQGLMNEGGYVRGYAPGGAVVPKDADLENPTPFNPDPFSTVGASFFSPYNTNVTPDPNLPPTTMPVTPNPESGISFVTMVNPATGAIQVVQFMGGNPVDEAAYNKLLSNGFYVQGSPELAAYKQKIEQDNRESDKDGTPIDPHPMEASISELGKIIAQSSKGGKSLLEMIPGVTGAVTGKLAMDHRNDISRALAKTIADTNLSDAQRNAAQLLQNVWTNSDLSAKQRKEAIAKSGIFKQPSIKNALGTKAGKYMSENWFGLATKDQLEKQFGGEKATKKAMTNALNLTEKKFTPTYDTKSKTYKYGSDDKDDGFVVTDPKTGKTKDYRFGVVKDPTDLSAFDTTTILPPEDNDNNNNNTSGGSNNNNNTTSGGSNNNNSNDDNDAGYEDGGNDSYSSDYEAQEDPTFGLMNKGGIVKKRKKKKTKKY